MKQDTVRYKPSKYGISFEIPEGVNETLTISHQGHEINIVAYDVPRLYKIIKKHYFEEFLNDTCYSGL